MAQDVRGDQDQTPDAKGAEATEVLHDRRRPGRINEINPSLVGLLRGPPDRDVDAKTSLDGVVGSEKLAGASTSDDLNPARGIMIAVGISIALWAIIFGIGWFAYRNS